jgi:hypothetical protein
MISYSTLQLQNATTSNAIIDHYASNASFQKLAKFEGDSTIQRDKEDDNKLAKGIAFAQQKGVLDPKHVPQPYTEIDVLGKTPEDVATTIMDQISNTRTEGKGSVIVLCGLSGTGKVCISTAAVVAVTVGGIQLLLKENECFLVDYLVLPALNQAKDIYMHC